CGQNLLGFGVAAADSLELERALYVGADHSAAKSGHDPGKDGPDLASADHSHSMADEIETDEAVELEIALARSIVGPRNLAIEREKQANGKLRNGVRRIVGHPHNLDAKFLCRCYVDVIEASGTRRNELCAAGGEIFQYIAVDGIVYEDADGREPCRQ